MVLYPVTDHPETEPAREALRPAWDVIAAKQAQVAARYWLITQPDHAALSGGLAALVSPRFFALQDDVVRAIELHDAGWALYPCEHDAAAPPPTAASGKPLSFLEIDPAEFIPAWQGSIQSAAETGAAGGIIVSQHFCRLAQTRLRTEADTPADVRRLSTFLEQERRRQAALCARAPHSSQQLEALTDVLQFCDLLSLYLCCGARESVEFPQRLAGETFRLHYGDGAYRVEPSRKPSPPDAPALRLTVRAWRYPWPSHGAESHSLQFVIR